VESFTVPLGYNDTADHIANFYHAIGTRQHVVEDEVFAITPPSAATWPTTLTFTAPSPSGMRPPTRSRDKNMGKPRAFPRRTK